MNISSDFVQRFRNALEQIFIDFSNEKGEIDLRETLQLIKENNVKNSELFIMKLQKALQDNFRTMRQQQFVKYFSKCDDKEHLSAVFDMIDIDKSQNISKQELAAMNIKYNMNLSPNEIKAMINQISSDGQKVTKAELIRFMAQQNS